MNETAPALRRAWALSQGNYLRLLAVLLAILVPILLVMGVAEVLIGGRVPAMPGAFFSLARPKSP